MWDKKVYPLDKSKKKCKGIRKQRHHAVSSNQLLVPDTRGTLNMKAHWSRLNYGSANWMLSQLMNEFDDDYDMDYDMEHADGDVTDREKGHAEHEAGEAENDLVEAQVYLLPFANHGGHGYDIMGHADCEQDEAEMMGYICIYFERDVESEGEWTLIGDM